MIMIRNTLLAGMVAVSGFLADVTPSTGAAFFAWRVTYVPEWDTLNVRAAPNSDSKILVAYPNGTILSMTGVCTKGIDLSQIAGLPAAEQRQHVRFAWCQTWVDPHGDGNFQPAWVYGKFIAPAQ